MFVFLLYSSTKQAVYRIGDLVSLVLFLVVTLLQLFVLVAVAAAAVVTSRYSMSEGVYYCCTCLLSYIRVQ